MKQIRFASVMITLYLILGQITKIVIALIIYNGTIKKPGIDKLVFHR
jgi:hypothetical protein